MGTVTTSLREEARSIFRELGYTVSEDGSELRAERKWRVVHVTTADPESAPTRGDLRCFVTHEERAPEVRRQLRADRPDYDWAVVAVDDGGEYEVLHPDAATLSAP